jgi:hypothetical protein
MRLGREWRLWHALQPFPRPICMRALRPIEASETVICYVRNTSGAQCVVARRPKSPPFAPSAVRVIDVLAYPAVQLPDVTGPIQVFASANDFVAGIGRSGARGGAAPTHRRGIGYPPDRRWRACRDGCRGPGTGRLGAGAGDPGAPRCIRMYRGPSCSRLPAYWMGAGQRLTGCTARSLLSASPRCVSSPIRSSSLTVRSGPQPE